MRDTLWNQHYSLRQERLYKFGRRYILFHNKRHPREMGQAEIKACLAHLAVA